MNYTIELNCIRVIYHPNYPIVSGRFYRAYTGYTHSRVDTAKDVLDYEADELGNEDAIEGRNNLGNVDLSKYHASLLRWYTSKKKDAKKYGNDICSFDIQNALVVIPDDGDGGTLLLEGFDLPEENIYIPITDFYDYMICTSTPEELPNAPDIEDLTKSLRNSKYDWTNELNNYIIHENYLLEYGTI